MSVRALSAKGIPDSPGGMRGFLRETDDLRKYAGDIFVALPIRPPVLSQSTGVVLPQMH
jgi:hypothetical protein